MHKRLLELMLSTSFGRRGIRPLRSAYLRLIFATFAAGGLGLILSRAAATAPVPPNLPMAWAAGVVGMAGYALMGLVLFSLSASNGRDQASSRIGRIMAVWPLNREQRWLFLVAPAILVWVLVMIMTTPMVLALADSARLSATLLVLSLYVGALAGLSIGFLTWPRSLLAKFLVLLGCTGLGIWLLIQSVHLIDSRYSNLPLVGVYAILLVSLLGLEQSFRQPLVIAGHVAPVRQLLIIPNRFLKHGWFVLKLVRNRRSIMSLVFCEAIIGLVAVVVVTKHMTGENPQTWLLFSALIVAAFGCDVRGLSARVKAAEIESLRGISFFVHNQVFTAILVALALALPMFIVVAGAYPVDREAMFLFYLGVQIGSIMIGLLASSIFVPGDGELGSQFFAVMLASTLVLALPKLGHFSSLELHIQGIIWLGVGLVCYVAINLIEIKRRHQYATVQTPI